MSWWLPPNPESLQGSKQSAPIYTMFSVEFTSRQDFTHSPSSFPLLVDSVFFEHVCPCFAQSGICCHQLSHGDCLGMQA